MIYIVNVASQCGYTESNYAQLKELSKFRNDDFEFIIFPCNQFGNQEPNEEKEIEAFAKSKGFEGIIMQKSAVEGYYLHTYFSEKKKNIFI